MRRLLPLLGAVLVLSLTLAGTAGADTFRVARPHHQNPGAGPAVIPFTVTAQGQGQSGAMSFAALLPIWQAAGNAYGIPWPVLAAINKVETNFGSNLGPSSAGAVGWMQFMPSTWARWGIDANGDGVADPNNPTDAIFSAARYLAGCGGQFDITRAVYCYNHASWYVNEVMGLASLYSQSGGLDSGGVGVVFSAKELKAQLASARGRISASHALLGSARAQARKLARSERKFLRVATNARLLTRQLDARKRAVLLGVRRRAADARVNELQKRLNAATNQLGRFRDEANGPAFNTNAPALLSNNLFSTGGGSAPYSGVVSIAMQYLGVPYKWGGATPTAGFDCSGLVQYVFAQVGISLPHYTVSQWNYAGAVPVPKNQLQ
ncbi:MAG TPA: lytic murein transglycosylase, partial [Gaiellaceae bacterium]|nr:lytic murein transglycosylase [Gaiellaceae bacterium]